MGKQGNQDGYTGTSQLALLTHSRGNQIWRQGFGQRDSGIAALLDYEVHGDGELVAIELSSLVDVGQVPDLGEHIPGKIGVSKKWNSLLTCFALAPHCFLHSQADHSQTDRKQKLENKG